MLTGREIGRLLAAYGLLLVDEPPQNARHVSVHLSDDAVFGRALSCGVAGFPSEVMGDRSWRALPMTDGDPGRMLGEHGCRTHAVRVRRAAAC